LALLAFNDKLTVGIVLQDGELTLIFMMIMMAGRYLN